MCENHAISSDMPQSMAASDIVSAHAMMPAWLIVLMRLTCLGPHPCVSDSRDHATRRLEISVQIAK